MSEQSNIGNSVYTFDFSLVNNKTKLGGTGTGSFVPVAKGNIKCLMIEDNLANIGITGNVTFNNSFDIFSKLGVSGGDNKNSILFNINIKNDDFKTNQPDETSIAAIVQFQDSSDKINNKIDQTLSFTFEEAEVCKLKQHNIEPRKTKISISKNMGEALANTLIYGAKLGVLKTADTPKYIQGIVSNNDSYYNLAIDKFNKLFFSTQHGPGVVKLVNKSGGRVFSLTTIGEDTKNLIRAIESNQSIAKYVMESFTIAPYENNKVDMRESKIEKYDLRRPNYRKLFEEEWLNYTLAQHTEKDVGVTQNNVLTYDDLKAEFEKLVCGGKKSNLPIRNELGTTNVKYTALPGEFPAGEENLNVVAVKNAAFRSFIFKNTTISFKVTGNSFRKPGGFIVINDYTKKTEDNEPTGIWLVTSIRHIFEREIYTNEIEAVKFFSLS